MNKIKEIFSSDSHSSTSAHSGTHSATDPSHTRADANNPNNVGGAHTATRAHDGATGLSGAGTGRTTDLAGDNSRSTGLGGSIANKVAGGNHHEHDSTHRHGAVEGNATHDHQHLAAVTKEERHQHEVEEVTRTREVDRHVHHVASHVQPVKDTQHSETVHHQKTVPVTEIREQHSSTAEDRKAFAGLHSQHKDQVVQGSHDKVIVDKGEIVNENVHHHVHHVVQPVIERDVHEKHVIHTSIPVHEVSHTAPILHEQQVHEPMAMKDFVKGGGDLSSKLTHDKAGVLATGESGRDVRGPAEGLMEKLHLGSGHHSSTTGNTSHTSHSPTSHSTASHSTTSHSTTHGAEGLTGTHQHGGNHGIGSAVPGSTTDGAQRVVGSGVTPSSGLSSHTSRS